MDIPNSDRQGWLNRGKILAKLGKHKQALICYERAMEIPPNYYRAKDTLNAIPELLQCLELAESGFEQALEEYRGENKTSQNQSVTVPGKSIASYCYNWACFQALQGNIKQSLAYLEQAIQIEGDKYRAIIQQDSDFDDIRNSQLFESII